MLGLQSQRRDSGDNGFLTMTQRRTVTLTGTFEELPGSYNKARTHNLLAGWWGIPFGLIWTPIVSATKSSPVVVYRRFTCFVQLGRGRRL